MTTTIIYKENGTLHSIPDCKDDVGALLDSGIAMDDLVTVVVRSIIEDEKNKIKADMNLYEDVVSREIIHDRNDSFIVSEYMKSLGFEYREEHDIYVFIKAVEAKRDTSLDDL